MTRATYIHSARDDSWNDVREEKNTGKCASIGEGDKKNRQKARSLHYRRVWNRLYQASARAAHQTHASIHERFSMKTDQRGMCIPCDPLCG
ncbi:hypothetical protein Y032_0131g1652 [Ancylostoma ceylanicum]|uniref:Uncharacterized protein n=1 Tax=Ancylostoma ceylanicum TaxID=53326 RepID=A0A016T693_9BILA|nr:hypothetical protein Y032_0131g1652 [Ancylostoma ceylanicum]